MDFRLLGRLGVEADGRDLTPGRARERAVLALLLLRHPQAVDMDHVIDAVWGEAPPPTARTALHGLISSLRRGLGAERIETEPSGYRLRLLPGDRIDLARFEGLVEDAGAGPPAVRARMLREALDLFRGEPFSDLDLAIDLHAEAARLESLRLATEEAQVAAELELGRHREVLPRLERLVAEQPLREGLRGQLMVALYRAGRQADALRVAQDARTTLATELGVEPGPALQRLEQQVLQQDPELLGTAADGAPPAGEPIRGGIATLLAARPGPGTDIDDETVREVVHEGASAHGGVEVAARRGPAFAFARAREAAAASAAIQRAARRRAVAIGIGLHSAPAEPASTADQAARLADVAHPGQVVLSRATRDLLREAQLHELDVRELGEHRLGDLGPHQPLYQLLASGLDVDFPPTRGLDGARTNLPVQSTPLVDRRAELDAVAGLLRDPDVRVVTLTGTGGIGKTRLALHAAAEVLDDVPDGTWFVPLEALADAGLVPSTVAATIGLSSDAGAAVGTIARELGGGRTLVVLDNFEHVLAAADFVRDLVEAAPAATVLVTSRVPLRLDLEHVFQVPPLPVPPSPDVGEQGTPGPDPGAPPDVAALLDVGSVALFAARAAAVRTEFTLTAEDAEAVAALCRALEGLPLAIELAASRVGLLAPATILERLDRPLQLLAARRRPGPERHRAIEATIEWSHDLLEPDDQRLFADLAVFAGGWTLDAAEAVGGDGLDVVDALAGLVEHSLVRLGGSDATPRFGLFETIREHAAGKLDASGRRAQAEAHHAAYFVALAEAAEPHLRGNPGPWLARLEIEQDNMRAALDRLAQRSGAAGGAVNEARLAGALWRFWYLAGHLREGRDRLEHALAVDREPTASRVKALIGAAVMARNMEDDAVASRRASEALEISRSIGETWSAAYAQFMLGAATSGMGDDRAARGLLEDSVRAFRELGDGHSALLVSRSLAFVLERLGERDAAQVLYRDNLRQARADANGRIEASTLGALATIAFDEGRATDATLLLRESLRLHRELGDRLDTAVDLCRAARTLALGGHGTESARLLGALAAVHDELGIRGRIVGTMAEETRAALRRQLEPADLESLEREGKRLRLDAALEVALDALG